MTSETAAVEPSYVKSCGVRCWLVVENAEHQLLLPQPQADRHAWGTANWLMDVAVARIPAAAVAVDVLYMGQQI